MFLIVDQSYLIIKGFEIRNYKSSTPYRLPVGINVQGTARHIQIRNNHIHHIKTTATPEGADLPGADAHSTFIDPKFIDSANFNLHLQSTSPAIDAGENITDTGDYEIDGGARLQGSKIDIGADEISSYNTNVVSHYPTSHFCY